MKITVQTARGIASFRRGGIVFGPEAIELNADKLKPHVLDAIRNEPRLIVADVETSAADKKAAAAAAKAEAEAAKAEAKAKD